MKSILGALALSAVLSVAAAPAAYAEIDVEAAKREGALLRVQEGGRQVTADGASVMRRALRLAARETLKRGYDGFTVLAVTPKPMKATYVDTGSNPAFNPTTAQREYVPGVELAIAMHRGAPRPGADPAQTHVARAVLAGR